jgi:hypothetical protein
MKSRYNDHGPSNSKILLILTFWSFLVLLFLSPDSPLFGLGRRIDSAWFFMGGEAWMNGMKPYVDFTDSKGPLLWLIYGIGYLISPHNYVGVYVISSLFYTGTLFYNYKTAYLFVGESKTALMATLPMIFVYFWPWFHYEVRAEDFALLFVSISLYVLIKGIFVKNLSGKEVNSGFFLIGFSFIALTLIKFNIAIMQGVIILFVLWLAYRSKQLGKAFTACIIGAITILLPFTIYFLLTDTLTAFVQEYFINTFKTIEDAKNDNSSYWADIQRAMGNHHIIEFIIISIAGSLFAGLKMPRYKLMPAFVTITFLILATRHNIWNYYYGTCHIFILFLFISLLCLSTQKIRYALFGFSAILVTLYCLYGNLIMGELRINTILTNHPDKIAFQKLSDVMKGKKNPKILYYKCNVFGFGVMYEALPAGNQWAYQTDATPEMRKDHIDLLNSRKADFVVTYCREDQPEKRNDLKEIEAAGYKLKEQCEYMNLPFYMYERKK